MTMARMLAASTAREPDATAIVDGDIRLTYAEWQGDIRRLAGGLNELGLSSGDHLVAALSNRLEMASLYWACQTLGVIFTPFNWRASGSEIAYVIDDAEAKVVVYESRSSDAVLAAVTETEFPVDRLIRVDGKPIDVSVGHAAPMMRDWNSDGTSDLLVGQFGKGSLRVYRNSEKEGEPKLGEHVWAKSEKDKLKVPTG